MRILSAKLVTEREILVGVPDNLEIVVENGHTYIVEPVTKYAAVIAAAHGDELERVLLDPTVALKRGLLIRLEENLG